MLTLLVTLSILGPPTQVRAQGFAPEAGSVWVKFGYIYGTAFDNFAGFDERRWVQDLNTRDATSIPIPEFGRVVPFRSRSGQVVGGTLFNHDAALNAVWSPFDAFTVSLFVPVFRYVFYSNTTNNYRTQSVGPGDVNLSAGYQLTPRDQDFIGSSAIARVKIPTSFVFPYTNEALRGEGQVDLSLAWANSVRLASSLYLNGTLEYRHRRPFVDGELEAFLGDEIDLNLSLGTGIIPGIWLSLGYAGLWGQPWEVRQAGETTATTRLQRQFHSAVASVYVTALGQMLSVEGLALDVWYRHPITGQDHAVMYSGGLGAAYQF